MNAYDLDYGTGDTSFLEKIRRLANSALAPQAPAFPEPAYSSEAFAQPEAPMPQAVDFGVQWPDYREAESAFVPQAADFAPPVPMDWQQPAWMPSPQDNQAEGLRSMLLPDYAENGSGFEQNINSAWDWANRDIPVLDTIADAGNGWGGAVRSALQSDIPTPLGRSINGEVAIGGAPSPYNRNLNIDPAVGDVAGDVAGFAGSQFEQNFPQDPLGVAATFFPVVGDVPIDDVIRGGIKGGGALGRAGIKGLDLADNVVRSATSNLTPSNPGGSSFFSNLPVGGGWDPVKEATEQAARDAAEMGSATTPALDIRKQIAASNPSLDDLKAMAAGYELPPLTRPDGTAIKPTKVNLTTQIVDHLTAQIATDAPIPTAAAPSPAQPTDMFGSTTPPPPPAGAVPTEPPVPQGQGSAGRAIAIDAQFPQRAGAYQPGLNELDAGGLPGPGKPQFAPETVGPGGSQQGFMGDVTPKPVTPEVAEWSQNQFTPGFNNRRETPRIPQYDLLNPNLPPVRAEQVVATPVLPGMPAPLPIKAGIAEDAKLTDELVSILGLPRTLKASFDLSAPGRQGLALAFRHPVEWAQSWVPMIKAWGSEGGMQAVNDQIAQIMTKWSSPALKDAIHLYNVGPAGSGLERVPGFESAGAGKIAELIRKIPGQSNSERAYATFLNYQKVKTFDTMASALLKGGETNPARFRNLGGILDHALGYGAAPLKGRIEGQTLFSQRYMTSRFQFLAEPLVQALVKRDIGAARAATENLVAFAGGMASLLALGNETGAWDAEVDPRSSDFGKIRVGPQRIDFGAGLLPIIRTAARMATGEAKSITGATYDIDPKSEALKFFRNKLAPLPSEVVNYFEGENAIGESNPRLLSWQKAQDMLMPLIADSVLQAFSETGDPKAMLRAFGSELVGGGTSTYGSGQVMQADMAKEVHGKEYNDLYAMEQAEINRQLMDSGTPLSYKERDDIWWQARNDALAIWQSDIGEDIASDPFVQKALSVESGAELEPVMVQWARKEFGLSRIEADEAVAKFLRETKLDDYIQAYRKEVLDIDPGFIQSWEDVYEQDKTEYAPPPWARKYVAGK